MPKQKNDFKKIPGHPGYRITKKGVVVAAKGNVLKEYVTTEGATIRLKQRKSSKVHFVRDLLQKTYPCVVNLKEIETFVKNVKWVRTATKLEFDRVKCLVSYQGLGLRQTEHFDLFTLRDAEQIFVYNSKIGMRWRPNQFTRSLY